MVKMGPNVSERLKMATHSKIFRSTQKFETRTTSAYFKPYSHQGNGKVKSFGPQIGFSCHRIRPVMRCTFASSSYRGQLSSMHELNLTVALFVQWLSCQYRHRRLNVDRALTKAFSLSVKSSDRTRKKVGQVLFHCDWIVSDPVPNPIASKRPFIDWWMHIFTYIQMHNSLKLLGGF